MTTFDALLQKMCVEYIVNGKSVIEWVMERYQVKTDVMSIARLVGAA